MFIKLLGVLDLLVGMSLLFSSILPVEWVVGAALYLLIKGGLFLLLGDWMSMMDMLVAIYVGLVGYGFANAVLTALASLFLLQKGAFSIMS